MRHTLKRQLAISCAVLLLGASAYSKEAKKPDPPVQGLTINGAAISEDSCEVLASINGQKPELRAAPGLHVLGWSDAHPLSMAIIPDAKMIAIVCWRSEARLAPNDYLVSVKAGLNLYIKTETGDEANDRTIALEMVNGGFRVRLLHGPDWTAAEEQEMTDAMTKFNKIAHGGT